MKKNTLILVLISMLCVFGCKHTAEGYKNNFVGKILQGRDDYLSTFIEFSTGTSGVIKNKELLSLDNLLGKIKNIKNPLLVMLDELNDPHNLGAILRSGDAFSIDGIIFKSKNQVALTETVAKVSTGAINFVPCVQVVNLTNTIKTLKKNGFWVIGLDGNSSSTLKNIPSDVPLCLVVGSEGFGISRLVKENCDMLVKIPMTGHVDCLNASVACSIALYQIRNR